jgi:hypothetical protein
VNDKYCTDNKSNSTLLYKKTPTKKTTNNQQPIKQTDKTTKQTKQSTKQTLIKRKKQEIWDLNIV